MLVDHAPTSILPDTFSNTVGGLHCEQVEHYVLRLRLRLIGSPPPGNR